jgi:hypothetical protein
VCSTAQHHCRSLTAAPQNTFQHIRIEENPELKQDALSLSSMLWIQIGQIREEFEDLDEILAR